MRFTPTFIAALTLVAPLALAQSSSPSADVHVTYSNPGGRVTSVLAALSKAAGVPLEATSATADDVLTLRLNDMPLRSAMDQIATVTGGGWKASGNGFILYRNSDLIKAQQREEQAIRVKRIADAIQKLAGNESQTFGKQDADRIANSMPTGEYNTTTISRAQGQSSPGSWAISQLLTLIDPAALALQSGQRVVFSNQTTRMQKYLPGKSQAILREFIRRQVLFADAAKKRAPNEDRQVIINGVNPGMGPGDPKLGVGKAILSVRNQGDNSLSAQLTVLDTNGMLLAQSSTFISTAPEAPNTVTRAGNGKPILISGLQKEFAGLLPVSGTGGPQVMMVAVATASGSGSAPVETSVDFAAGSGRSKTASEALRAILLKPEQNDPTGITAGQVLVAAAEVENKNLVAQLPDSAVVPAMRRLLGGVTPVDYVSFLDRRADVAVAESEGGWIIKPELPITARSERISRPALGNLLRSIYAKGSVRLLDVGAFAAQQRKPISVDDLDGLMASSLDPNVGADDLRQLSFQNWNTLRIYGLMGPGQRQALINGNALSISQLSALQRDLLAEDYYNQPGSGGVFLGGASVEVSEVRGGSRRPPASPLTSEPTEILPDGIPGNGTVQVKYDEQEAVRAKDSKTGATRLLSVSSLAMMNSIAGDQNIQFADFKRPNYDVFQPATQARYAFNFTFSQNASIRRSLTDSGVENGAQFGPWDRLPAETRRKYDEAAGRLKNMRTGNRRGGPIPPLRP